MSTATSLRTSTAVRSTPIVRFGNFLFRFRNAVFPVVFVVIVFLGRPLYPFGSAAWDRALDAVGIALALGGQTLRALVIGLSYVVRGGKAGKVHAEDLVQEGIFAHSRNPLYVGNIAVFLGLFLVLNSWPGYLVGIPLVLLSYISLVRAEETFLLARFGEPYREYCRKVPRFLPRWHGLRATIAEQRFNWQRVVRKEYGSTWVWMIAVIALLYWEILAVEGSAVAQNRLPFLLLAWGIVTLAYGLARFLKKTRRLG
jgi:protein-S-isoprenylcysteine O-methyltransferase Ste14